MTVTERREKNNGNRNQITQTHVPTFWLENTYSCELFLFFLAEKLNSKSHENTHTHTKTKGRNKNQIALLTILLFMEMNIWRAVI